MTTTTTQRRCLCGCGQVPSKGRRWIQTHDTKVAPKVREFLDECGLADLEELFTRYRQTRPKGRKTP